MEGVLLFLGHIRSLAFIALYKGAGFSLCVDVDNDEVMNMRSLPRKGTKCIKFPVHRRNVTLVFEM